ncbi:Uncharacterised protein [Mycobacteroides abscessus subsp. abscessus]|nr:Uncharacterised protein [Mycobacteroides abscessus subsp. abscessus]
MSDLHGLNHLPAPTPTEGPSAHDLVVADLRQRREFGLEKYGTLLQPGNGRDSLLDAYEEVLDLAVYLRNAVEERTQRRDRVTQIAAIFREGHAVDEHLVLELLRLAAT